MTLKFVARASVPDGYFGDRVMVDLFFDEDSGHTVADGETIFYTTEIPRAESVEEVIWLIENNPICRGRILLQR